MSMFTAAVCIIATVLEGPSSPLATRYSLIQTNTLSSIHSPPRNHPPPELARHARSRPKRFCRPPTHNTRDRIRSIRLLWDLVRLVLYISFHFFFGCAHRVLCVASVWRRCGPQRVLFLIFTQQPVRPLSPFSIPSLLIPFHSRHGSPPPLRFPTRRLALLVLLAFRTSSSSDQREPKPRKQL